MKNLNDQIKKIHLPQLKSPVISSITNRWSPRFYDQSPVPEKDLEIIFEASRWTPSGYNQQDWQFFYTEKGTDSYQNIFQTLNQYNRSWAKTAPMLIVACFQKSDYAQYDLGAAVLALVLQAQDLGYHSRQMALFDHQKVKQFLRLDENTEPFIIIALGKLGDYSKAPPDIIEMELEPRPRKEKIFQKI